MEADIAHTITTMEQQWAAAVKVNDSAKVAPLLSEVFVGMDSDGSFHNKSGKLAQIKNRKWQVSELSNMNVTVHGGMAIVTGEWHGRGTMDDGRVAEIHECWLDTWLKNGKWQCVSSASTLAKS